MFPNPQDALPLPPRPNLEHYKKLAKELLRAAKSGEPAIREWSDRWIRDIARQANVKFRSTLPVSARRWIQQFTEYASRKLICPGKTPSLTAAQLVLARSHGFPSWPKFARHIEHLDALASNSAQFEDAADAIVTGDISTLQRLLKQNPELIRERSTREHGATLLHYVSANGVEGYRQKTPPNILDIAALLLDAGADIEAECDVYGGGATVLGLTATSVHPENAGVMIPLLTLLLDRGANMEKESAGNKSSLVFACLANGRPESARFLASRGAPLDFVSAAALDSVDFVSSHFTPDGKAKGKLTQRDIQEALRYASYAGANNVVKFLLDRGVDLAEHSGDGQTAAHYAVIGGQLETLKILLKYKPPINNKNEYGGSVLGQAMWSAAHGGDPETYIKIFDVLIAAGAEVPARHVPINPRLDEHLRRYGSEPEPTWWWYGEGPPGTE